MRHSTFLAVIILTLSLSMVVSCQPVDPTPRAILNRAIAAHGGRAIIQKHRAGQFQGVSAVEGAEISQDELFELPARWKRTTSTMVGGEKRVAFKLAIDGKCWDWEEGGIVHESKTDPQSEPYLRVITVLLDLADPKTTLSPLAEKTIETKAAIGILAKWRGGHASYYFDKGTGLLAQAIFEWQPEPGERYESQVSFADYRDFDGLKIPWRRTSYIKKAGAPNFILVEDFTLTNAQVMKALPANSFARPNAK